MGENKVVNNISECIEGVIMNMMDEINYGQILNSMFNDLAIVNKSRIMIYVTNGFELSYNTKKEFVIGRSIEELEKLRILNPSVAKKVFETGKKVIMSHTNKNGKYLIINGMPIYGDDGSIDYVVSYSVPNDEITSLQAERDKLIEKLGEYKKALNDMQKFIKQDMTDLKGIKSTLVSINRIKQYDVSVLFTGESGVGKTTFAKYVHEGSHRAKGPFVEISCGTINENLLESELFGYKKGSFTGANQEGKIGLIQTANSGTLFLDEIGELSLNLQVKLLKVLQNKTIMPVGGTKEMSIDFRLITATNKNLKKMVELGTFREDLFYRINVITIDIPPLRQRPEDCMALIKYFVDKFNMKYDVKKVLDRDAVKKLCSYPWPGNIRELENTMERLILMTDADNITMKDLPDNIAHESRFACPDFIVEGETLPQLLKEYEKYVIKSAVKEYKTSVNVAKKLGISQPTAARKIKEYIKEDI